jgi:S1-C subfamily serine protease
MEMVPRGFMKGTSCVSVVLMLLCVSGVARSETSPQGASQPRTEEEAKRLVVMINGRVGKKQPQFGAGLIIGNKGNLVYVLTARHVLFDNKNREVRELAAKLWSRPDKPLHAKFPLRIMASSEEEDLALATFELPEELKNSLRLLSFYCLADSQSVPTLKPIFLIGQANSAPWNLSMSGNTLRAPLPGGLLSFESSSLVLQQQMGRPDG